MFATIHDETWDCVQWMSEEDRPKIIYAFVDYLLHGKEPCESDALIYGVFKGKQFDLDQLRNKALTLIENGKKGGRPKKNWGNSQKPENNQTKPEDNQSITNDNHYHKHKHKENNISKDILKESCLDTEWIYQNFYGINKGVDRTKCDKLLVGLLNQGIEIKDIIRRIVLYNSECRIKGEFRYVKKLETWLKEYQNLDGQQIDEMLSILVQQHRAKVKDEEKYKNGLAKTVWTDLCNEFGVDRMNDIRKSCSSGVKVSFIK